MDGTITDVTTTQSTALVSYPLAVALSPATVAALTASEERLTGWPDEARWQVLDGDVTDPAFAALFPPSAHHTACLADAVLLLAWLRGTGVIAMLARDHAGTPSVHRYAIIAA